MGKGGVGAVIGFAVGAALSFVGGGPVGTAVWIAKGIQGAAVGYSLLSGPSTSHKFGEVANTRSNVTPIPVIYGEHRVGGNIIYERVSDNEKELYVCVGIGEGEVQSISDIEINGQPISEIKDVTYKIYTGTQSQTADSRVLTGERFPNTAYIAFTFKANDQIASTPNITCVVKGRKVRVWKNGAWVTEFSNNPVWAVLDLLTNKRYGLGKDDGVIDLESFKAEATYCNELIDGEKRFELDYVIDTAQSSLDILSNIMATFRANLLYSDGQLRLKIEKSELPVQAFTMDNIVAKSFSYSLDSINEMPNQLIGQFSDRSDDWELGSVIYDNEIDQEARGVFSQTLTLAGVTRPSQVGRLIRYYHDLTKLCDTFCEFQAGIDAIHCEAGDVITVSHDVPGWIAKEFLILEMQEAEDDLITLRCRAYDSAIYHDKGSKYQPSQALSLPNPLDLPPSVTNLQLSEAHKQLPDGTWVPQIRATWDLPNTINWKSAHVWLSDDAGANWIYVKEVEGTSTHIDVVGTGEYRVRLVSENWRGVREDFGLARTSAITIIGKQAKPPNVTWADCSFVHNVALSWLPVDAKDIAGYEIRTVNDGWGSHNEQLIYKGTETKHSFTPTQRNYTFYVKAFDRHGNYSEVATAKSLSLPAPEAPPQPEVKQFFRAVQIGVLPLNNPAILGYNIYITEGTEVVKIPALVGGFVTYSAPSGTVLEIQVVGYDVIGEGVKSEYLQATTTTLQDRDIPEDIITPSKLTEDLRDDIDLAKTSAIDAVAQISDLGGVVDGALAEIDNTKQRVSDVETDLLDAKNRLSGVEDEVDSAKDRLLGAESRLSSVDDEITDAKDRLGNVEIELENIDGTLTTHDQQITNIEGELSSKVSQSEFNSLEGTVIDQGTQITQNATAIESKADQSEVDTLSGTVSAQSTLISQNATAITQKADKSTVDTLTGRVSAAEATLSTHADEIEARATKEEVDAIEGRVTEAEGQLTVQAGKIEAKAEKSEVQALEEDLSSVSIQVGTLTTSYDSISARVTSVEGVTDDLTDEVSGVKSRTGNLEVRAGNIEASVSEIEEDIDEHGNRLASVENAVVNVLPGQITLKADASEVYKKGEIDTKLGQKADSATVSELTTRITGAEQTIDAHAGAIAQKAERTEVYTKTETDTKLGTKVDTTTYNQKVGELTTSIEGITGRVSATETEIDDLTGEVSTVKSDVASLDIRAEGIESTVSSLDEEIDGVSTQVTQLADRYSVKTQKTSGGKTYATGFVSGIGEDNISDFSILSDRFRIFTTESGEDQAIFVVDAMTNKLYLRADLIADGSILANHVEADAIKTLLVNAGVAFIDHANILRLKAESIVVGQGYTSGIVATKPQHAHLWHFDTHLYSTDGIAPQSVSNASIVPDGGIAGGALQLGAGGSVVYDLPSPVSNFTWAGFYEEG